MLYFIDCPTNHVVRFGTNPQPSCRDRNPSNTVSQRGCFCTEGMILNERTGRCVQPQDCPGCSGTASGDPHYLTYDGRRYDLFDECAHIFTKDCKNETFTVYSVTSDTCSGGREPTCIDEAVVVVPHLVVHLRDEVI